MKSFFSKLGNKSLEYSGKLGSQRHLTILRDAFALMTPLIIAGALSVLVRTFIFGGAGGTGTSILGWIAMATGDAVKNPVNGSWSFVAGTTINDISSIGNFAFFAITHATIDMMSIYIAFLVGYFLTKSRGSDSPIIGGLLGLGSFFIAILGKSDFFDAKGLITAILISIFSSEIYVRLEKNKKLLIKMPDGVPPAVARAFAKLFPTMIVATLIVAVNLPFVLFGSLANIVPQYNLWNDVHTWTIGDALFLGVQSPFLKLIGDANVGLAVALVFMLGTSFLWFFGLHGSNILMGIFSPIYVALYNMNVNGESHIFVQGTFDAFIMIGGTGATFAFIVAVFLFSRNAQEKEIAKLGLGPAIFQINEPIIFGNPMVLNVKYALPFIFTMPILTITTWLGFKAFSIHPVVIWIPWTTPVGIGGLLATSMDWKGMVLALINFGIAIALWTPFVILWSKGLKKEKETGADKLSRVFKGASNKIKTAKAAKGGK